MTHVVCIIGSLNRVVSDHLDKNTSSLEIQIRIHSRTKTYLVISL